MRYSLLCMTFRPESIISAPSNSPQNIIRADRSSRSGEQLTKHHLMKRRLRAKRRALKLLRCRFFVYILNPLLDRTFFRFLRASQVIVMIKLEAWALSVTAHYMLAFSEAVVARDERSGSGRLGGKSRQIGVSHVTFTGAKTKSRIPQLFLFNE